MVYIVAMAKRGGSAHVATIKTKGKDGAQYTSYLLRRSYREGGKVRHENLGNLSHLPIEIIEVIRAMLAGRRLGGSRGGVGGERAVAAPRSRSRGAGGAPRPRSGAADQPRALPRAGSGCRDDLPAADRTG